MKLPVENKELAIYRVIILTITTLMIIFILSDNRFSILYGLIVCILVGLLYILKNNIKKVILNSEKIEIDYNRRKISVPISNISSVEPAFNGLSLNGKLSTTYFVKLNQKYPFGKKILLRYRHKEMPIVEPVEIGIIKAILKFENNKNKV